MMLRALDEGLWVAEQPLKLGGVQFGTRATIARLSDGRLWIACPVGLQGSLQGQIEALGPVAYLVAPNRLHYFYLAENARAFPNAEIHLAPGLAEKRKELPQGHVLGDGPSPWSADLDQTQIDGWDFATETVFLQRSTRTLVMTDLCFNLRAPRPLLERCIMTVMGAYDRFGPSRLARVTQRDRKGLRASLDRVLAWDFERIVLTHGDVVDKGGRELLREAYAFL